MRRRQDCHGRTRDDRRDGTLAAKCIFVRTGNAFRAPCGNALLDRSYATYLSASCNKANNLLTPWIEVLRRFRQRRVRKLEVVEGLLLPISAIQSRVQHVAEDGDRRVTG
jgi:hypothetical protein